MRPGEGRSLAFDRVADEYDATRGGEPRGRVYAEVLDPLLPPDGPVIEVGVGTGVVARGLHDLGRTVVGVDLSPAMLQRAAARLGPRVVVGDAQRLPVRDGAVAAAYSVWVLHLVADRGAVLREVHRVVRPGGRYVVGTAAVDPPEPGDEIGRWLWPMQDALRGGEHKPDHPDVLGPIAAEAGWRLASERRASLRQWEETPAEVVATIESRTWSLLWELDDSAWADAVQPAIDGLRAMPDPDRPRSRNSSDRVIVLERP